MKFAFATALMVASATAFSAEFIQGCETGIFLADEKQFADYSCPMPTLAPQAKMFLDMIVPMETRMKNMNQGKPVPALETLSSMTHQLAILYSLFWGEYDGGDFCQGLIFSKEIGTIFWDFGKSAFESFFEAPQEQKPIEKSTKHRAVEGYLNQ